MNTIISNKIIIDNPNNEVLEWCNNNLVVNNPKYVLMQRLGKEDNIRRYHIPEKLNLFSSRYGKLILPYGVLTAIWKFIKTDKYTLQFNNNPDISIKNETSTIKFYDYQEEAIQFMVNAKSGVLVSPAGSGKTYMGTEIIRRIGKKALWLCHTGDLLRQAKKDMEELYPNIKIGLTTQGNLEIGEDVTISTIQTMVNVNPELYKKEFDVVICDECAHVAGSDTQMQMFQKIIENIPARYKFGLTATPYRSDGMIKSMYALISLSKDGEFKDTFKVDKSRVKTIVATHCKYDINMNYSIDEINDLYDESGMMIYNQLIDKLSNNIKRNDIILNNIEKCYNEGRKQVVLSSRISHCEYLVEKLQERGIKAVLCVGRVTAKKRKQILNQEVEWDVLVATYSLLKEGVSIKELDTLHLTTPFKDPAMVIQCAGRIERYLENKKEPIVYDYVDVEIPYCIKRYDDRRRALKRRF